jgi:hypothetical protein
MAELGKILYSYFNTKLTKLPDLYQILGINFDKNTLKIGAKILIASLGFANSLDPIKKNL